MEHTVAGSEPTSGPEKHLFLPPRLALFSRIWRRRTRGDPREPTWRCCFRSDAHPDAECGAEFAS